MNTQYEYPEQYAKYPMTYSEGLGEQTIEEYCEMIEGFALQSEQMYGMHPDEFSTQETDRDPFFMGLNHLEAHGFDEDSDQYKNYQRMCELIQGCYGAMIEAYDSTYREIIGFTVDGPISGEWQMPNPFDRRYSVRVLFAGNEKAINIPVSYFEETWGAVAVMRQIVEDHKKKKEDDDE